MAVWPQLLPTEWADIGSTFPGSQGTASSFSDPRHFFSGAEDPGFRKIITPACLSGLPWIPSLSRQPKYRALRGQ